MKFCWRKVPHPWSERPVSSFLMMVRASERPRLVREYANHYWSRFEKALLCHTPFRTPESQIGKGCSTLPETLVDQSWKEIWIWHIWGVWSYCMRRWWIVPADLESCWGRPNHTLAIINGWNELSFIDRVMIYTYLCCHKHEVQVS